MGEQDNSASPLAASECAHDMQPPSSEYLTSLHRWSFACGASVDRSKAFVADRRNPGAPARDPSCFDSSWSRRNAFRLYRGFRPWLFVWTLAVVTIAPWSSSGAAAASATFTASTCTITSVETLLQALINPQCDILHIHGGGLLLSQTSWATAAAATGVSPNSLLLSRNLTLQGNASNVSGSAARAVLDCGYLKSRIVTSAGVAVHVHDLTLVHCRQPSALLAYGLDLLVLGMGSQLLLEDVTYEAAVCAPLPEVVRLATALPRPATAEAGEQAVRLVQGACPPETEQQQQPDCSEAVRFDDYVVTASAVGPGGIRAPGDGLVRCVNVTLLCMEQLGADCVAARGMAQCAVEAVAAAGLGDWDAFDAAASGPEAAVLEESEASGGWAAAEAAPRIFSPDDAGTRRLLAIVVPTAVLGLGLLMTFVGLLVWTRRRRRFSPCPVGIKEAYEGVVFVGLSQGSDVGALSPPTFDLDVDLDLRLNGGDGGMAAAVVGLGGVGGGGGNGHYGRHKPKQHAAALGPGSGEDMTSDDPWIADGHRYPHSWDCPDGRTRGLASLTASNCTSAGSAPGIVGIIVAPHPTPAPPAPLPRTSTSTSSRDGTSTSHSQQQLHCHLRNSHHNRNHLYDTDGGSAAPAAPPAPMNLVLGVDVIVTTQPVLGRSPVGSAMLGQFGQVPVAVKVFHRDCLDGSLEELRALWGDVQGLARVCGEGAHPHVLAVLGAGEAPGTEEVFLLEELMATNLARLLHGEARGLPMERALSIALDVALALLYLHPNIVHRNLKPESVLLDSAHCAKLADYGLGRLLDFGTQASDMDVTRARYLAPECFKAQNRSGAAVLAGHGKQTATPQADMFSFGVLLWEMLSREVPWPDLDATQIAVAVGCHNQRLDIPNNDRFPPKIRKLILQCWEQEPRKRPSAAEAAKRLSAMLHQQRAASRDGGA